MFRALLASLLLAAAAPAAVPVAPVLRIPPRAVDAMTGSEFAKSIEGLPLEVRSQRVLAQLRAGNVPDFLRRLVPVKLRHRYADLTTGHAVVFVSTDYLAIGSDDDFFRIPVNLYTATAFAREFGLVLPTARIIDAVHEQSDFRLRPAPMKPGKRMRTIDYYRQHHTGIEQQIQDRPRSELISGHKKDLVLTRKLTPARRKVAIYGWHRRNGKPIQPVSTVHVAEYADYSHGLRLVHDHVLVNGVERSVYEVLADPRAAKLLSHGGAIPDARAIMGYPAEPAE